MERTLGTVDDLRTALKDTAQLPCDDRGVEL
jgi:hypothetical protein